jgi:hypothetical protein
MNHIAFRMPAFIFHVTIDLDELLENGTIAPRALCGEARRIMIMAIHIVLMLVVRILLAEYGRAHRASEMLHMELLV